MAGPSIHEKPDHRFCLAGKVREFRASNVAGSSSPVAGDEGLEGQQAKAGTGPLEQMTPGGMMEGGGHINRHKQIR
jgi:hypothetical protein